MTSAMILDAVVAVLLVVTVVYCWRLNQRLTNLRKGREELAALVETLTQATMRAEHSIGALKSAANDAKGGLASDVANARALRDELAMITETGNNLANRLEERLTSVNRTAGENSVNLDDVRASRKQPARDVDSAAREEMLNALRQAR